MLPHSVPRSGGGGGSIYPSTTKQHLPAYHHNHNNNNGSSSTTSSIKSLHKGQQHKSGGIVRRCSTLICIFCIVSIPSFLMGIIFTHITHNMSTDALITKLLKRDLTTDEIQTLCKDHTERILDHHTEQMILQQQASDGTLLPLQSVGRYAAAIGRVSKQDFTNTLDLGVPLDPPSPGAEDVLLLYSNERAMPNQFGTNDPNTIPELTIPNAIENCDYLNIILTDHGRRKQCIAIVPQYESFHIQKWMRINEKNHGKLDSTQSLQMVSRGYTDKGRDNFAPPYLEHTQQHWQMLQRYLDTLNDVLAELKPKLQAIAIHNTVIVMVCNFGQSELLINFVCSAQRQNIDLQNIIVFTTDPETTDIVEGLGLTAFYDERNFGEIPTEAARRYGDAKFVAMMMAKVICVQLVSLLGYDFLFQDVDIVWYKHPLEYFHNPNNPAHQYDAFFQDDGGHSVRYAPYSANSGFYYIRHNNRTRHFLTSLLMAGDLILKTDSHQQALIATLNEHVSLYGLKAKVLSRDMEEFPGGYQFHQHSKKYMKEFYSGIVKPYVFHMSWTLNKNNKLLFLRQMGEWYVEDVCISKKVSDIPTTAHDGGGSSLIHTCCSAEPIFSCHYRDKPSMKPCTSSPPIDKGRPSWW